MHHVERAVILAAGIGKRMRPITYDLPKPLIRVHGKRMIDMLIQRLNQNGIREIYVVVGHRKECFAGLAAQFPGVTLIGHPWYANCNTIASLYCARDCLENAMILNGNQIIYDDSALSLSFENSGFNAVWTDGDAGATDWQLCNVSRWSAEDGAKLRRHVETEFAEKRNMQIPWEDLVLFHYSNEYKLGIHKICPDDLIEINTLEELAAIDPGYAGCVGLP